MGGRLLSRLYSNRNLAHHVTIIKVTSTFKVIQRLFDIDFGPYFYINHMGMKKIPIIFN